MKLGRRFQKKSVITETFAKNKSIENGKYVYKLAEARAESYGCYPKWAKKSSKIRNEIRKIYVEAQYKCIVTRRKWQIDHECPLWSSVICGLHVPWNLQILSKKANESKSNTFVPVHYVRGVECSSSKCKICLKLNG